MVYILVIEDEENIRDEVVDWLRFEGYEAESAPDGQKGVKMALRHPPDLILCDIMMPIMDGYQVLEALRNHPQTLPIPFIFLTARADKSFMRQGMQLGADDYLTKPFTPEELLGALRARLARHAGLSGAYLRELEDAKTRLARLVAHELKTPLTAIRLVRDVIDRQLGNLAPETLRSLLETLTSGTDRMHHLVEQIVYITQIDTDMLDWEKIRVDGIPLQMWQILPSAVELGRRFSHRNKEGEITIDERDGNATILGETQPLKHALAELIANALDFSPPHTPVMVTQWQTGTHVHIVITDQGVGMSLQQKNQAQKPFEQVGRDMHEQQGMGLGLTVARQIIEAHGGTLDLQSVQNKGTQVTVTLPVAPPEAR